MQQEALDCEHEAASADAGCAPDPSAARSAPDGLAGSLAEHAGAGAPSGAAFDVPADDAQPEAGSAPAASAAAEDATQAEVRDLKERLLRARAELDNVQKRTRRELDEFRAYAIAEALADMLPVLDNLDMTVAAARQGGARDPEALLEGVDMIRQQLEAALLARGAQRIDATGKTFDPNVHEALTVIEAGPDTPSNTVVQEVRRGYRLKERVLRPTQVIVAK